MDFALLGTDHRPAALGFDFAHGGVGFGHLVAHTIAVRDLVKAVAGSHRSDFHRLEQDVITGITGNNQSLHTKMGDDMPNRHNHQ